MRIRNNLLAQYFPELDRFYSACETESLAIVRWFLDPSMIACMEFDEFFSLVTTHQARDCTKAALTKDPSASSGIGRMSDGTGCRVRSGAFGGQA